MWHLTPFLYVLTAGPSHHYLSSGCTVLSSLISLFPPLPTPLCSQHDCQMDLFKIQGRAHYSPAPKSSKASICLRVRDRDIHVLSDKGDSLASTSDFIAFHFPLTGFALTLLASSLSSGHSGPLHLLCPLCGPSSPDSYMICSHIIWIFAQMSPNPRRFL